MKKETVMLHICNVSANFIIKLLFEIMEELVV